MRRRIYSKRKVKEYLYVDHVLKSIKMDCLQMVHISYQINLGETDPSEVERTFIL